MKKILLITLVLIISATACENGSVNTNIEIPPNESSGVTSATEQTTTVTTATIATIATIATTETNETVTEATTFETTYTETSHYITDIPETPPPPPPEPVSYGGNLAYEVLDLVNAERAAYGLHALAWDENFAYTARIRAQEIISGFYTDHSRPDGSAWFTVINEAGIAYSFIGENMAKGGHPQTGADWYTPTQVMAGWMASQGHRDNILNGNYYYLGVGIVDYDGMRYYVQHFGAY
ncbi:MAG: CAP domain-containing protein [Oscillospiraceae bacterium]|nr:CAP domain-containing protein [Oscillospiraceae bacterium]